ncbi:MAG: glycosyltransferase [Candidatus Arsenophonus phytopathogenicus]
MNIYDFIFITNIPAFYKVNLFNRLAKHCRIKVIFIAKKSKIRNNDFYNYHHEFAREYINTGNFEDRDKLKTLIKVYKSIKNSRFTKLIYPGWEIKELFVKRMSSAYPSEILQKKILEKIKFKGKITLTHGVGIPNYIKQPFKYSYEKKENLTLTYLYVGRLSEEKNLSFLVEIFNERQEKLIIIGDGPEAYNLKRKAKSNISFLGYINNKDLKQIYKSVDVFILPSKSEPWGLVIEEALTFGLPVIVSNKVGCKDDLVFKKNGLIFDINNNSFRICLDDMNKNYKKYFEHVNTLDMKLIYEKQVESYLISLE